MNQQTVLTLKLSFSHSQGGTSVLMMHQCSVSLLMINAMFENY